MGFKPTNEPTELAHCVKLLEKTGLYRVLRKLPQLKIERQECIPGEKVVAIIDTETTGLDTQQDEIIEFAGIGIKYNEKGEFTRIVSSFSQMQEPKKLLKPDIARLTGITPTMLAGQKIDMESLDRFIDDIDLIVAHNASFDRPFCERLCNTFRNKPWACSATEIDWASRGFNGTKLTYLLTQAGWFYDAHRAVDDCNALAHILNYRGHNDHSLPFEELLKSARAVRMRLAFRAAFSSRAALKAQGFRWMPSSSTAPGHWYIDILEEDFEKTMSLIRDDFLIRENTIRMQKITAYDRYRSDRNDQK